VQVTISQAGPLLGVQTAWGRVFFPYGPAEPPTRLVPSAIRALLHGEPAPCSEGRQVRDFIYVEDVARAFVLLLASSVTGPVNIASGVDVAIGDVVTAIGRLIGRPELLQIGALPMRDFEPREITADISILASLGFMPAYTLEQGLQRAIDWWKAH
jgi:nucleoside-diphosphate-sugar epimerase